MTKQQWQNHKTDTQEPGQTWDSFLQAHQDCPACRARRKTLRANRYRRERDDAARSCGLIKTPYGWE